MSTPQSRAWQNADYTEEIVPMSRMRAQAEIDWLYGTGKITKAFWELAFERISGFLGKDFRFAIAPTKGSSAK